MSSDTQSVSVNGDGTADDDGDGDGGNGDGDGGDGDGNDAIRTGNGDIPDNYCDQTITRAENLGKNWKI